MLIGSDTSTNQLAKRISPPAIASRMATSTNMTAGYPRIQEHPRTAEYKVCAAAVTKSAEVPTAT